MDRPRNQDRTTTGPELSRRIPLRSLGGAPAGSAVLEETVEASASECVALARRLDVPAVHSLRCRFRLQPPDRQGRVMADGLLQASMVRTCVATLEDFPTAVAEAFTIRFVPDGDPEAEDLDGLDPEADDDVPYNGTMLDLGEAAAEQLALALDPYPREPGAELPPGIRSIDVPDMPAEPDGEAHEDVDSEPERIPLNPFAVLASRRRDG